MDTLSNLISLEILIISQFELLPVLYIAFILCFFSCLFLYLQCRLPTEYVVDPHCYWL